MFSFVQLHCNLSFFFFPDLIQATNETNVNIPQMADTLFERATNSSWVVVFKALITTHHLMVHGNEVSFLGDSFDYEKMLVKCRHRTLNVFNLF